MKKYWPLIREFFQRADIVLFLLCLTSAIFGLVVISSATATSTEGSAHYVLIQSLSLVIGVALFVALTVLDIDVIADKWPLLYLVSAVLLLLLIPFGYDDGTGNKSWLRFLGIGIQPSEIIKVVFIIVLSKHISYLKEYKNLNHVFSVAQLVVHFFLPFALVVVISADLGSALTFLFIFLVLLFTAGLKLYWFILGAAGLAAAIPFVWTNFLREDQIRRIMAPYDSSIDPTGEDVLYQTVKSKLALASGQLTGSGLYQGTQTQNQVVPAQHTDFIFSVIGEELGMIGCCVVILLLLAIILRCVVVGLHSRDTMSMLVCFGVAATVLFQSFINIGMCTGLTPVIGLTLPFFSYGGSSLFSLFAAMGLVSGVKFRPKPERFSRY
ncbi:MAG: FtsW/RodA/SpoVE family cell cycle protein [Oscillospiraceae bacterium]|nr:FtsW/RodA/SpoVE family cell cycle protein [Oscillospiraceae bacterium]